MGSPGGWASQSWPQLTWSRLPAGTLLLRPPYFSIVVTFYQTRPRGKQTCGYTTSRNFTSFKIFSYLNEIIWNLHFIFVCLQIMSYFWSTWATRAVALQMKKKKSERFWGKPDVLWWIGVRTNLGKMQCRGHLSYLLSHKRRCICVKPMFLHNISWNQ